MPKDLLEPGPLTAFVSKITEKIKSTHLKANDCKKISADILSQTGFTFSKTTLKRLFGFAVSNYQLSGYTKNAPSNFLGYADWATFVINVSDSMHQYISGTYWNQLRKKAKIISNYIYTALKNVLEFLLNIPFIENLLKISMFNTNGSSIAVLEDVAPVWEQNTALDENLLMTQKE